MNIKYAFISFALFCAFGISAFAETIAEGDSAKRLEDSTSRLSARLTRESFTESGVFLSEKEMIPILEKVMYPPSNQSSSRSAAESLCRKEFRKQQTEFRRAAAEKLLEPFRKGVSGQEWSSLISPTEKELQNAERQFFDLSFRTARKNVVSKQKITGKIYPSEAELERFTDDKLIPILTKRFTDNNKLILYEENVPLLKSETVIPVLNEARTQQTKQKLFVKQTPIPADQWDPKAAGKYLLDKLDQERRTWQAEHLWNIFPECHKIAAQRAARLIYERMQSILPELAARTDYRIILKKDSAKHRNFNTSSRIMFDLYRNDILEQMRSRLNIPSSLEKKIRSDVELTNLFRARFNSKLLPEYVSRRKAFSAEQYAAEFPELKSGSFLPEMTSVEKYAETNGKTIPVPEKIQAKLKNKSLLEETEAEASKAIRSKFGSCVSELALQKKLTDTEYKAVVEELKKDRFGSSLSVIARWFGLEKDKMNLTAVIECYEKHVLDAFNRDAARLYPNDLFPSVREEIEMRSKVILQQLSAEENTKQPDSQLEKQKEVECFISISASNNNSLNVRIGSKQLNGTWNRSQNDAAVRKLTEAIQKELKKLASENAQAELKVILLIRGPVYYQVVANIRESLKASGNITDRLDSTDRK